MLRPILLLTTLSALAACSGGEQAATPAAPPAVATASTASVDYDAPPIGEVGNVCSYRQRRDPVIQGFRDRTGTAWEGEVRVRDLPTMDNRWFRLSDKRVATIVARPRVDTLRVRVDDNCYNAETKTYSACTKVLGANLAPIRGFARALTIEQARSLAIQLCERKVAEVMESSINLVQDSAQARCRVMEQTFCDLPPAPPPPAATKKK